MDALFLFRSLRQLFGRRGPDGAPVQAPQREAIAPAAVVAVATQPAVARAEAPVTEPEQAPLRKMRTLEEVRADLARLRLSASERHARVYAWRDTNFAPTDFMDLAKS